MAELTGRTLATELYDAALRGAAAGPVTARAVGELPLDGKQRVWVFAIGKAAHVMAAATVGVLQRSLHEIAGGIIVSTDAEPSPHPTLIVTTGDHPVPGARSFRAAQRLGDLCTGLRPTDAIIILLSGGATSLIAAPARGIADNDLIALFELLLEAGLAKRLPPSVRDFLTGSTRGVIPETLKPNHPAFAHVSARVVANNRAALDGATVRAFELGLPARIVTAPLTGEAAARGEELARSLLALREMTPRGERRCLVWGGETTVKLGRPLAAGAESAR